jgi:MerR family transcriptional regulator, Zn(II)-responsive regulator of zntA
MAARPQELSTWPKQATYKIGDVARLVGSNVSTLRYYEREGLLSPERSAGGTRLYNDAEVARFKVAIELTALGVPLKDLVELTRARPGCPTGGHSSRLVLRQLSKLRAEIQKRRDDLDEVLHSMSRAAELVSTCFECTKEPTNGTCPECPCSTRFHESSMLALTWSVRS